MKMYIPNTKKTFKIASFYALSIFLLLTAQSCKKDKEVAPNLAQNVQGTYKINSSKLNNVSFDGLTGTIVLNSISSEKVSASIAITFQGSSDTANFNELSLKNSNSDVDIYQGSDLVGTVSGKNIKFFVDDQGDLFEFGGTK